MLASEYGGGPRTILDTVYLDELFYLIPKINQRRALQWKMAATIASVPYMEKDDRKRFIESLDSLDPQRTKANKFDEVAFSALKMAMSQNPRVIVKSDE